MGQIENYSYINSFEVQLNNYYIISKTGSFYNNYNLINFKTLIIICKMMK